MTSRAALLPTPGDPYVTKLWLSSYEKYWKNEIDHLYVHVNCALPEDVMDYSIKLFQEAGATVLSNKTGQICHGVALTELFKEVKEDLIFFSEDDFYVQHSGLVANWFDVVETNKADALVSYRGSCSESLSRQIVKKFGLTGDLILQPNFWPCLCVVRKADLQKTDLWFDSKSFPPNTYIKELDWTTSETVCGDTFVWMSIQLRALGLRFAYVNQKRLIDTIYTKESIPPWVHTGTKPLVHYSLLDENNVPLGSRGSSPAPLPVAVDDGLKEDFCRRAGFGFTVLEKYPISADHSAFYFNDMYRKSLMKFMSDCNLSLEKVVKEQAFFNNLLSPTL